MVCRFWDDDDPRHLFSRSCSLGFSPDFSFSITPPCAFTPKFLVGPNKLDVRKDDTPGGVFVERCRFLEGTNCKVGRAASSVAVARGVVLWWRSGRVAASTTTIAGIVFWARYALRQHVVTADLCVGKVRSTGRFRCPSVAAEVDLNASRCFGHGAYLSAEEDRIVQSEKPYPSARRALFDTKCAVMQARQRQAQSTIPTFSSGSAAINPNLHGTLNTSPRFWLLGQCSFA